MPNNKPIIGAHVSAAGGIQNSVFNATSIGAEAIQIFGSSPRRWNVVMPSDKSVEEFKNALKESEIKHVFLHAPYLVNLASLNQDVARKSEAALKEHMNIAAKIEARGVIFHVGSVGKDNHKEDGSKRVSDAINKILKNTPDNVDLIMENASGGGGKIGVTAQELSFIYKNVDSERLKVCFDTAHAFGAGVVDMSPASIKNFFDELESQTRKGIVCVIHANDSKAEFASGRDLHENIGEGLIGKKGFENLAKEKRATSVPWILEVPGFDKTGPDKKNIEILHKCLK